MITQKSNQLILQDYGDSQMSRGYMILVRFYHQKRRPGNQILKYGQDHRLVRNERSSDCPQHQSMSSHTRGNLQGSLPFQLVPCFWWTMSQRFFEGNEHAILYAKSRPNAPPRLAQKIISFLKEKVPRMFKLIDNIVDWNVIRHVFYYSIKANWSCVWMWDAETASVVDSFPTRFAKCWPQTLVRHR